jgi:hypothetical protein
MRGYKPRAPLKLTALRQRREGLPHTKSDRPPPRASVLDKSEIASSANLDGQKWF